MAPEQAEGGAVDQRTDIYALGLVLYELLAGSRPRATKEGGLSDLLARLKAGPPPLQTVNPLVPADLARVVSKCIEHDPGARYQSADALLSDLDALGPDGRRLRAAGPRTSWKTVAAALVLVAMLIGGTWWVSRRPTAPAAASVQAPVSVLIANFENKVNDPIFQESLEQALAIAMEGAPFITAYPRRDAAALARQLDQGAALDEATAKLVATREGIRVVLAGLIEADGTGYHIQVRTLDPGKEAPIAVADARASDKGDVLGAVAQVAATIRTALGDTVPSGQQQAETFTAGTLEAVRSYTIAQELSSNQKDEEAIERYREAISHDPKFGRAHAGWAVSAFYLGRRAEAEEQWKRALALMDRMTEREKLRTYGAYYLGVTRNYDKAIENYASLVQKYPADLAGHSNLALAYFYTRNLPKALEEGRRAVDIYPRSVKFRSNYALYLMYAGEFEQAATQAEHLVKDDPSIDSAYLPLAMKALAEGKRDDARAVYERAASTGPAGASLAVIGLADVAMYEGKYEEASGRLEQGIAADRRDANSSGEAAKRVALAETLAAAGRTPEALTMAAEALKSSEDDSVLFPLGRLYVGLNRTADAQRIVSELSGRLPAESRAYARLLEAEQALKRGQAQAAVTASQAAKQLADLWLVRFVLGLAYFQAGHHAEALSELEACLKRRGEATAVFFDDLPTFHYLAALPYWIARSQEALGQFAPAATGYRDFLALRSSAAGDPLVADARRRAESPD